jgi:hypothetical protein
MKKLVRLLVVLTVIGLGGECVYAGLPSPKVSEGFFSSFPGTHPAPEADPKRRRTLSTDSESGYETDTESDDEDRHQRQTLGYSYTSGQTKVFTSTGAQTSTLNQETGAPARPPRTSKGEKAEVPLAGQGVYEHSLGENFKAWLRDDVGPEVLEKLKTAGEALGQGALFIGDLAWTGLKKAGPPLGRAALGVAHGCGKGLLNIGGKACAVVGSWWDNPLPFWG